MNIVIVAPRLAPFSGGAGLGDRVAGLAAQLLRQDNQVHVILPMAPQLDPSAHSLAKRLRPVETTAGGRTSSWFRYDGRTPSGLEAHLLTAADGSTSQDDDAFCGAAVEVMRTLAADTSCLSWGTSCAAVCAIDAEKGGPARVDHLVILDSGTPPRASLGKAAAVLVLGRSTAAAISGRPDHPVSAMLDEGTAMVLPRAVPERSGPSSAGRGTAKASLQLGAGLPVRVDVPLFLFPPRSEDLLGPFLRGDVQALAPANPQSAAMDALQERYPDRLALTPDGRSTAGLMAAADFCVSFDPDRTILAMDAGSVPVVSPEGAEGVVDLEPSLESGSGLVAQGPSRDALLEALGRAIAAFDNGPAFRALSERLPAYTTDQADQAGMILALMERSRRPADQG